MTNATEDRLDQAFDFMQQNRLAEARQLLRAVLADDPDDADAWWLLANATEDPDEAHAALQNVLVYNPEHDAAQQLMRQHGDRFPAPAMPSDAGDFTEVTNFDDLYEETPPALPAEDLPDWLDQSLEDFEEDARATVERPAMSPPEDLPETLFEEELDEDSGPIQQLALEEDGSIPALQFEDLFDDDEDDLLDEDDEFDVEAEEEETEDAPRRRRPLQTVLLLLIVVVVALLLVVLLSSGGGSGPGDTTPATQVVEALQPSDAMQAVLDDAQMAANSQSDQLGGAATALYQSRGGQATLIIQVCRPADTDLFAAMDVAMDLAAVHSISVQEELVAIGADLINCIRQDVLLSASASLDAAMAYANGDISLEAYRSTWQWQP